MEVFVGLAIAVGIAYAVYQDAVSRAWEKGFAILMAICVFSFLIVFLPIYLLIKDNPGRAKVALAANRAISAQTHQGIQTTLLDPDEIGKEVGIRKLAVVRQMLMQCQKRGEIPHRVSIG